MLKKVITYTDYNGTERTEDYFFNLSKAELMEMEYGRSGGFADMLQSIVAAKDEPAIFNVIKSLLLKSYGKKSADGRRFEKSPEISEEFSQTEAYVQLFMELGTDAEKAIAFIEGILPQDLVKEAAPELEKLKKGEMPSLSATN